MAVGEGRKKIIIDKEVNEDTILDILTEAWDTHLENIKDMRYLIKYYKGKQDIQSKRPVNNTNINNKVSINYANSSIRNIVGYTFGKPIQVIQRKTKHKKDIQKVVDIMEYENFSTTDNEVATMVAITGIGYFCTLPTEEILSSYMPDMPIKNVALNNYNTFVVQSARMGNPDLLSCTYYTDKINTYFLCFTETEIYRITCRGRNSLSRTGVISKEVDINPIGLNPINMVINNPFIMGDFETAISILNAINKIASNSMDDIDMVIQSLLVIINAEINNENVDKIKEKRILEIIGAAGQNVDAKFIYQQLDSAGMQNIREYVEEAYKEIIGIPDRKTRGGGGGDTGDAVKLRDGWADIEIVARNKESYFKLAKKKQIAVVIAILQNLGYISKDLTLSEIDVKFSRNKNDNLQSKAQSYSTIIGTKTIAPEDALEMADMTTDVTEVTQRGLKFWEEQEQKSIETNGNGDNQNNQANNNSNNINNTDSTNNNSNQNSENNG